MLQQDRPLNYLANLNYALMHSAPEKYQNARFRSYDLDGTNLSKALHMLSESCRTLRDLTSAHKNS